MLLIEELLLSCKENNLIGTMSAFATLIEPSRPDATGLKKQIFPLRCIV